MDEYNYPAFSFGLDGPGIETWLRDGPKPGELAPAFELPALDGGMIRSSDLLGRAVVIEFGSYTCPIFCGHVPAMEALAKRHPDVSWLVIYTREAHPAKLRRSTAASRTSAPPPAGWLQRRPSGDAY